MKKKVLTVLLTGAMVASMAAGATVVSAEESDNTLTVWAWDQNFNIKSMQIAADQYAADHGVVIDRWYEDDGILNSKWLRPLLMTARPSLPQQRMQVTTALFLTSFLCRTTAIRNS